MALLALLPLPLWRIDCPFPSPLQVCGSLCGLLASFVCLPARRLSFRYLPWVLTSLLVFSFLAPIKRLRRQSFPLSPGPFYTLIPPLLSLLFLSRVSSFQPPHYGRFPYVDVEQPLYV